MKIDKNIISKLEKQNNFIPIAHLFLEWISIATIVYTAEKIDNILFYFFTVIFVGARFHGISVIGHELLHLWAFNINVFKRIFLYVFVAIPLIWSIGKYFKDHLLHHKHLNTPKDPDYEKHNTYSEFDFPMKKHTLLKILLLDLTGISFIKNVFKSFNFLKVFMLVCPFFIWFISTDISLFYIKYFLIPHLTWYPFISRLRLISEHYGVSKNRLLEARNTIVNWFQKTFFIPHNANFHLDHHLFPKVPYYNLKKLHNYLLTIDEYKNSAHITKGYFNVLKECWY